MKIKFYQPITSSGRIKCTIHKNGKLGFSRMAIEQLGISQNKYIKLGFNDEDKNDNNLYILIQNYGDNDTYKIIKAGNYFYVNTQALFDKLNFDYEGKKIIFDIQEMENNDIKLYKLNKREISRKKA